MNTVAAVQAFHSGRDPRLLAIKWTKIRTNPFAFFRGVAPLFYEAWCRQKLPAAPRVWICGDAHLENVGSYKGDNRVPYFDLNDFDEACLAPAHWDIGRALTGLFLLKRDEQCANFLTAYRTRLLLGKPLHIEPEVAIGVVRRLLRNVQLRGQKEFLAARVKRGKIRIRPDRTFVIDAKTKKRVLEIFRTWAKQQVDPQFYRVQDVCGRIAGNGSLGVERYAILVRGHKHAAFLDMKQAAPNSAGKWIKIRQPRWKTQAERVASVQKYMQYVPAAHLGWTQTSPVSYIIRELQPIDDKIEQDLLATSEYTDLVEQWAGLIASAHLRSGGWMGSASLSDLMAYADTLVGSRAARLLEAARQTARKQLVQYAEFRRAKFDSSDFESRHAGAA